MELTQPYSETPPSTVSDNPFSLIAYMLFKFRHSLEDVETAGRPPRWVRIARVRDNEGVIAKGVHTAVEGLSNALWHLVYLALRIEDVLEQTDAAKALAEVSLDFLMAATEKEFINGLSALVPGDPPSTPDTTRSPPIDTSGIRTLLEEIKKNLHWIPEPEDMRVIGHELYRLLCIEQEPLPLNSDGLVDGNGLKEFHIDPIRSGKVTLMRLAFERAFKFTVPGVTPPVALTRLGARRLWMPTSTGSLHTRSIVQWRADEQELQVDLTFNENTDLVEANTLLEALGYATPVVPPDARKTFSLPLRMRLLQFQFVNRLPLTGRPDNTTLNALLNLDYRTKNLRQAQKFPSTVTLPDYVTNLEGAGATLQLAEAFPLVNPSADRPELEGFTFKTKPGFPKYRYYVVGAQLPETGPAPVWKTGGWISDSGPNVVSGFVAIQSRLRIPDEEGRHDGGMYSEGEAANGHFFFCARFNEPWAAGRTDPPSDDALFSPGGNPAVPSGNVSRIYQWLPLKAPPPGWQRQVTASCLRRALFEERTGTTGVPDQGSIALEFYNEEYFPKDASRGTRRDSNKALKSVESEHYPDQTASGQAMTLAEVVRKRVWVRQELVDVDVPDNATGMLVMLQGYHQAGHNIDAYFDEVQVTWQLQPIPAT